MKISCMCTFKYVGQYISRQQFPGGFYSGQHYIWATILQQRFPRGFQYLSSENCIGTYNFPMGVYNWKQVSAQIYRFPRVSKSGSKVPTLIGIVYAIISYSPVLYFCVLDLGYEICVAVVSPGISPRRHPELGQISPTLAHVCNREFIGKAYPRSQIQGIRTKKPEKIIIF